MNTIYRIVVKAPHGVNVVHTEEGIAPADLYSKLRELEQKYPGHRIQSKAVNPLGL